MGKTNDYMVNTTISELIFKDDTVLIKTNEGKELIFKAVPDKEDFNRAHLVVTSNKLKELKFDTDPRYCEPDCPYLIPTEKQQNIDNKGKNHMCNKYHCRILHHTAHPNLFRCKRCFDNTYGQI